MPGHHPDHRHDDQADQHGHQLQQRLQPVAEPSPAQARQHQLALLVHVFGLQTDQPGLLVQEGGGLCVERLAGLRGAAKRQTDRGRAGLDGRFRRRAFGRVLDLSQADVPL